MQQPLFEPGTVQPLLSLMLASLIVMGSPGPATISVTAIGGAFGLRRSLPYLAGIVLGTSAVLVVVAAGLASVLLSLPRLAPVLIGLSAAYIVYLAFRIATAPALSATGDQTVAPAFAGGFLLGVANPKAYVAIAAVFAGTDLGMGSPLSETTIKIAVLAVMIVVIHVGWLLAGAAFARLMHRPLVSRIVNVSFAAILIASTMPAVMAIAR